MPNWVSVDGVWYPAKEHAVLPHLAGTDKEVYDGPDRAALYELYKAGVETFGSDFHHDSDMIQRVKALGFDTVDQYALSVGWDKEKVQADFKKKAAVVTKHELPKRVEALKTMGGGVDLSGGGLDRPGGFGNAPKE